MLSVSDVNNDLKRHFRDAKRCPVPMTESRKAEIKRLLKQGAPKKILCTVYGLTYEQLKRLK